jgi:hypothetical protein
MTIFKFCNNRFESIRFTPEFCNLYDGFPPQGLSEARRAMKVFFGIVV